MSRSGGERLAPFPFPNIGRALAAGGAGHGTARHGMARHDTTRSFAPAPPRRGAAGRPRGCALGLLQP